MSNVGSPAVRHCTRCGAQAAAGSTFCTKCGRVLELPVSGVGLAYCRDCGSQVTLGDVYCPQCGAPQSPKAPAPPARATEPTQPPLVRVEIVKQESPDLPLRIVWFVFAGFWLGLVVSTAAWLCIVSVIGLPVGIWLAHRIPAVMTLRARTSALKIGTRADGTLVVSEERPLQLPFSTRAVYFVTVGWWASLIWLVLAWVLAMMIIPIPVAMWMYDRLPAVTTLEKY